MTGVSRRRAAAVMLRFAWTADRRRSVWAMVLIGLNALAQSLFALWLKYLVDGVARSDLRLLVVAGTGAVLSVAAITALSYAGERVLAMLRQRTQLLVQLRVLELVAKTPTLEIHETPRHLAELDALQNESFRLSMVIPSLLESFTIAVHVVVTTGLLLSVHPLLLLLPLFGVPVLLVSPKTSGLFRVGNDLAAEPARRAEHLVALTASAGGAKEVRLFRLGSELLRRFHLAHREIRAIHHRIQLRAAILGVAARTFFVLGYVGAIALAVQLVVADRLTVGDAVLIAVLAGQVLGMVSGSADVVLLMLQNLATAGRYVYLVDVAGRAARRGDAPVPTRLVDGIALVDVSYRYPGASSPALDSVNLRLPAGATVAVVGDNGSGKSTLVKLLAGLYVPTSGEIAVDGVSLAAFDPEAWRRSLSAGFQDHARFELTLSEAVGIGDLSTSGDASVLAALRRAGASDLVSALPAGLGTRLGPRWDGGVDLSGGQWQKVALGRAMMRRRPLLLLLDEPTAALDADTEHRLFTRWTSEARRLRAATGAVTVLVSHRFSTVRMADLIVVLAAGRVVEVGSHVDLMASRGLYAELFDLQARSYR